MTAWRAKQGVALTAAAASNTRTLSTFGFKPLAILPTVYESEHYFEDPTAQPDRARGSSIP